MNSSNVFFMFVFLVIAFVTDINAAGSNIRSRQKFQALPKIDYKHISFLQGRSREYIDSARATMIVGDMHESKNIANKGLAEANEIRRLGVRGKDPKVAAVGSKLAHDLQQHIKKCDVLIKACRE